MQLKKVELNGFKSFANKTQLVFQDGITTIVGPNGSGKSNISDAVRWVLGEQSAKSLRGGKMEDVIFAGTQSRKMVGYAEVIITISNESHKLPVDYNEVEVTRRLYRSGESQYFINKNQCRLKDVQELFMDTGVGKDGYSIISQGKIDEVLSSKSEERRSIFEEAAGIVKYKSRKEEAEKKLKNAEENLLRVGDILTEITDKIGPLQEQAIVARRFLEIKNELKYIDVCLFLEEIEKNNSKISEYLQLINVVEHNLKSKENKLTELTNNKVATKERIDEILNKIESLQEEYYKIKEEANNKRNKIESDCDKIRINNDLIEEYKTECVKNNEDISRIQEEINAKNLKKENYLKDKERFTIQLNEKEIEFKKLSTNMDTKQKEIEDIKENISKKSEENAEILATNSALEENIENILVRKQKLAKEYEGKISEVDLNRVKIEESTTELTKINEKYKTVNSNLENNQKKLSDLKSESAAHEEKLYNVKNTIDNKQNEHNMLIAMEEQNEGYSKSVKAVLELAKDNKKIYGTVASLIKSDEKYEFAIECLLGNIMQNIVVDTEETAKECINYLKSGNYGRATFLPLSSVRSKKRDNIDKATKLEGFIGFFKDLVSYNNDYEEIMNLAFSNSIIVDNIENGIKIAKAISYATKIVTLNGEILTNNGSISGGSVKGKSTGLVGRNRKIESLKEEIIKLTSEYEKLTKKQDFKTEILDAENLVEEIKSNLMQIELEKNRISQNIEHLKHNNMQVENLKAKLLEDKKEEEENIIKYNETIVSNKEIVRVNLEYIKNEQIKVDEYSRFNKQKSDEADILNEDITDLKISLSSFDDSAISMEEIIEKYNQDIINLKNSNANRKNSIKNLEAENDKITNAKLNIDSILLEFDKKIEEKMLKINSLKEEKETLNKKLETFDLENVDTLNEINNLKEEKLRLETKREKIDSEIEFSKNRMWNEYEITTSKAKDLLVKAEEKIALLKSENNNLRRCGDKLRQEMKNMGNVNVAAIEEYAKTKERYDFLTVQKEDLEATKEKLLDLIDKMILIMKKQFRNQFKIINENFNEVFKNLFGGGKANLELEDDNNILECGIDIQVQPPGKKLQNMSLLSGGERALTAIALLFAILKIKAPPFCILDEIEAALDDINVQRFAKYIKKYSDDTQFVVITHRKGTMEVAKTVYGVTMQEYGISNIVSMKMK